MSNPRDPKAELRQQLADKLLARWVDEAYKGNAVDLPVEGQCDQIAGWVADLFTEVERIEEGRYADGSWPQRAHTFPNFIEATHVRYEVRTAPEPIRPDAVP